MINKYRNGYIKYYLTPLSAVMVFMLASTGCTIKLIADYDEVIDKSVTELQKKVETFLTKMERVAESDEGKYENYITFYEEAKVALSALRVRSMAVPKNEITVKQIEEVEKVISKIEGMHKEGLKTVEIEPLRRAINAQFTAILKLELAKKRGEKISK